MLDFFKYEQGIWYPHMKPRDIEIWERFIEKYPEAYANCQYDFHVGDAPEWLKGETAKDTKNQHMLYQLKIDVLGYKDSHIDLIEVKPNAGPASIGQVLGYKMLYERDEKPLLPVFPVIVTNELKLNMDFLCNEQGVKLYVV